ncbi:hypothetical protein ACSBL2_13015 [Pedobacter sp. AW31-3R]|uniref:hypothetical protein n=1 Tax=Pedobacter sp. AW31-3R TaxID=3445781 RepID=UPI003FA0E740
MDEHIAGVLAESNRIINRLQLLSVFFQEEVVLKIYLRSKVIHQLFENNTELSIDKLELFHLQFTSSVIELLRKIKKNNEKNVTLIYDEIQLNKEVIAKLNDTVLNEKNFLEGKKSQSLKVNISLRNLFEELSGHSTDFPFVKNITRLSARYAKDFYYTITADNLAELINYEESEVYISTYGVIEKKLMGLLCKLDFKTEFVYGLKSGMLIIEIYKFVETEQHFLFFPSRNLFLFCNADDLAGIGISTNVSEKGRLIQELSYQNDKLESNAASVKTYIPAEIISLLEDNYTKISDLNFLNHLNNFDVQANILKAMLNTDLM